MAIALPVRLDQLIGAELGARGAAALWSWWDWGPWLAQPVRTDNIGSARYRRRKIILESFTMVAKLNTVEPRVSEGHLTSFAKDQMAHLATIGFCATGSGSIPKFSNHLASAGFGEELRA